MSQLKLVVKSARNCTFQEFCREVMWMGYSQLRRVAALVTLLGFDDSKHYMSFRIKHRKLFREGSDEPKHLKYLYKKWKLYTSAPDSLVRIRIIEMERPPYDDGES